MKSLKVLAICSSLILLTSSQCGRPGFGMGKLTKVDSSITIQKNGEDAHYNVRVDYPAYMLKNRIDSISYSFYQDQQAKSLIGTLTDVKPTSPRKTLKSISGRFKFRVDQSINIISVFIVQRLYRNGNYLEEEPLFIYSHSRNSQ